MSSVYNLWFVVMILSSDRTINEHSIHSLNVCAAEKQIVNKNSKSMQIIILIQTIKVKHNNFVTKAIPGENDS